jgi:hypothetical protein
MNASGFSNRVDVSMTFPPNTCDHAQLSSWFKLWRLKAREGYAREISKYMPKITRGLVAGVSCIDKKESFDVRYEPSGDYFALTCLAQSKVLSAGKKETHLTHVLEVQLLAKYQDCLSDSNIDAWVNSDACKVPGETNRYFRTVMLTCGIAPTDLRSDLRGTPSAYAVDVSFFNQLINARPSISKIVDNDRKVKGTSSSANGNGDCGPLGCLSDTNSSGEAK